MCLSELCGGDRFRIVKVTVGGAIGKRLVDMGLNHGVEGVMVRCAMLGDPVQIALRGYNLSLRLAEAAGVEVDFLGNARPGGRFAGRGLRGGGYAGPGGRRRGLFGRGRRR